jgi:hypothetical protein
MSKVQRLFITSVQISSTGGSSISHQPYTFIDVRGIETKDSVTGKIYRELLTTHPQHKICIAPILVFECLNPVNVSKLME